MMKIFQTLTTTAVSIMLLLQGCGGGGGSNGGSAVQSELGRRQVPTEKAARARMYNDVLAKFAIQAAVVHRQIDGMLSAASHGYTTMPEAMSDSDLRAFFDRMNAGLPEYAKLMLVANDLANTEAQMDETEVLQAQPRFILTAILVSGVAVGMAGMFKWAIDANNERIHIVTKAIANATPKELQRYNEALGIDPKSSKQEALSTFNHLGFREAEAMVKRMESVINENVAEGSDDRYAKQLKAQAVKTVKKSASIAVTTVVGEVVTAAGGQGVDKAISGGAKLLGASAADAEVIGAVGDLIVSAEGKQPLDILASHLTVVASSKTTYDETVPTVQTAWRDAVAILQGIAEGDFPDALGIDDLAAAADSVMRNIGLKSGRGIHEADGSITLKIPYRTSIATVSDPKNGEASVPMGEISDADVIVAADGKVPQVIENQNIEQGAELKIEAKALAGMTLEAAVVSSDADSVVYRVSAVLTGVEQSTTVRIALSNASTGTSTKTLDRDGSVSWTVTVLADDATVTVTRSDNAATASLRLKGTGTGGTSTWENLYVATLTPSVSQASVVIDGKVQFSVDCAVDTYSLLVKDNGSAWLTIEDGAIGTIRDGQVAIDYADAVVHGTIAQGTWSEKWNGVQTGCHGTYHGHFASAAEIAAVLSDCAADTDCKYSADYTALQALYNAKAGR